jgi:arylsulfatase A-like enzyme
MNPLLKNKLLMLLGAACLSAGAAQKKPNVVFIITDDQAVDDFGFLGGNVHTPRLDRMVKEGLLLTDFNVTTTVCSPSRYSFMTGRYAGRCTGVHFMQLHPEGAQTQVENVCELETDRWSLPKVLQRDGYRTGFVGKSHLVRHDWLSGKRNSPGYELENYPQNADPRDPEVNAKMHRNHQRWCDEIKKDGFDYVDGVYAANLLELRNDALNVHNLDWSVSKAFEFLESCSDEPFFLYFATTLQHGPDPRNEKHGLGSDPQMCGEGYLTEPLNVLPSREDVRRRNREAGMPDNMACYLWEDDGIGAILDKIRELGMEEDTLVIFVPDHGYTRYAKSTLYDYGMRVPMILQWKGTIPPGMKYDGITANIDIAPTILELCGAEVPADYAMDGMSLKSVLMGDDAPVRDLLFAEMGHSRGVKTKNWKYIAVRYPAEIQRRIDQGGTFENFEGHPRIDKPYLTRNPHLGYYSSRQNPHYFEADQLYNLKRDPAENDNVFEQYPEVAAVMQAALKEELAKFPNRPFGEFTGEKKEPRSAGEF